MTLRLATSDDLLRLSALRDGSDESALSDPALATDDVLRRLIAQRAVSVWEEAGAAAGFAAVDGGTIHLLVDPQQRRRGIGRALLAAACERAKSCGQAAAVVTLPPGGGAERHYRAAGWIDAGRSAAGGAILKKKL